MTDHCAPAPAPTHTDHGSDAHCGGGGGHHDPGMFRRKFWLSLALTIPTLVFSHGLQDILGLNGPRFAGSEYIPAVFGIILFCYGGTVFLTTGWQEIRAKKPGMMTLIALAILVALGYSLAVTLGLPGMDFWWELSTLITIMLLGHWIEMAAVSGAQDALGELAALLPDTADVFENGHPVTRPLADVGVGAQVLVRPGATIPVDGQVVEGDSEVNESLLTGESATVHKRAGDPVIAGSINEAGALTVEVTRTGSDTALAGIMKLVADAQASKSGAQLLADRAAALLFYVAVAAAIVTLIVWSALRPDEPTFVLERVVTVLIIACPHALGLAIPLVAQISTAIGAKQGILIRDRVALEAARTVVVVLFDKTGTLTEGRQGVTEVVAVVGSDTELLNLAASVEARAEHPVARAIVAAAEARSTTVSDFVTHPGLGVSGVVDGAAVVVGNRRLAEQVAGSVPAALADSADRHAADGKTAVYLVRDAEVVGLIVVADVIRPEAREAVRLLSERGIRVGMISGDSQAVAQHVAAQVGITEVFAEVLPADKASVVAELQRSGARVAMVGDGVNDAPALARADVGFAIGAGTDVAIESAGIILASSDPRAVADTLTLSQATYRKSVQNLWWGAGYNIVGLPLAAGVLVGAGFVMPPAVGAALMAASTIVVALNAQLLRRTTFARD